MKTLLSIVVLILVGVGLYYWWDNSGGRAGPNEETATSTTKTYSDATLGVSFSYPSIYYVDKKDLSTPQRNRHALVLTEDTEENRQLREGVSTIPREGPTAITVDLFQNNLDKQTAAVWAQGTNDSNFKLGDQKLATVTVDGLEGVRYHWSGLYEGDSVVIADDRWVYMLSVTYLTPQDRIRGDFDTVVANFRRIQSQQ